MFAARMVKFCIEPVPTPAPTMNTLASTFTTEFEKENLEKEEEEEEEFYHFLSERRRR